MRILRYIPFVIALFLLASCEREELPVNLPPKGTAQIDHVDMGEDYRDQLFYDMDAGQVVQISAVNSWDLAFETTPTGFHVFINGGKDIWVHNTKEKDIKNVTEPPNIKSDEWVFDAPDGLPDSTAIGDWLSGGISKNEVYIIKLNPAHFADTFKKIQLVHMAPGEYIMNYCDLRNNDIKSITIPKDEKYNFSYFSFANGGHVTYPEPPKENWDFVFTRYRHIYYDLNNFPYIVVGALLNPYKTTAFCDSSLGYEKIDINAITWGKFTSQRNAIGFLWKNYDFNTGKYTIDRMKTYVIKNRKDQYWKLRFLDFYNATGVKGSPAFEYERLQ